MNALTTSPAPRWFELQCSDVHGLGCCEPLRATSAQGMVMVAREHGAREHGFTPVWYSAARVSAIAEAVGLSAG